MTTTDKLAEAARQYLIATAHLGACPGTREVLERAIAEAEAKPAPAPLTDEQMEAVWVNWCRDKKSNWSDLVRAIERAHGIGKGGAPAAPAPQLPPMPEPHWPRCYQGSVPPGAYTADQMQAYARAAISASKGGAA